MVFILINGAKDFSIINTKKENLRGLEGPFVYQVFHTQNHIKVYKKGIRIKEICIHTAGECPPTDHILNMMCLINNEEHLLWEEGNIYNFEPHAIPCQTLSDFTQNILKDVSLIEYSKKS